MAKIFVIVENIDTLFKFDHIDLTLETNISILNKLQKEILGFNPNHYSVLSPSYRIITEELTLDLLGYSDSNIVLVIEKTPKFAGFRAIGNGHFERIALLLKQKERLIKARSEDEREHERIEPKRIEQEKLRQERIEQERLRQERLEEAALRARKSCSFKPALGEKAETDSSSINASLYAPSQIKRASWEKVQVFLYKESEFEEVEKKAATIDPNAKIMTYTPLDMNLSVGDVVDVKLRLYDEGVRVPQDKNRIVWQGSYKSCEFVFQVPMDSAVKSVAGEAEISINGIQIGKLVFNMDVVEKDPKVLNTNVIAKPYRRIFISYSHKDKKKAELIAKTCNAQNLEYFYDRHTLNPGDDFDKEIEWWIRSADLFILCWSKHAAKSEYVKKEYSQAIEFSELKKPPKEATLKICPFNISPKAKPPVELAKLNFEEL